MGQLERYGLYVLVLVIFLILGVAIWGGDPEMPKMDGKLVNSSLYVDADGKSTNTQQELNGGGSGVSTPSEDLQSLFDDPVEPVKGDVNATSASLKRTDTKIDSAGEFFDSLTPTPVSPPAPSTFEHKVRTGENPSTIAHKYGLALNVLMAANPGIDAKRLQIGQKLLVPAGKSWSSNGSAPQRPRRTTYIVRKNDIPSRVARRIFGSSKQEYIDRVLKAAGITDPTKLRAGTKLVLEVN